MNQKNIQRLGWVASVISAIMYISYIAQIISNLHGVKGNFLQPMVATLNCTLWTIYGWNQQPKKDWPIIAANLPGIFLAAICTITSF